jgi:hypothetical protein
MNPKTVAKLRSLRNKLANMILYHSIPDLREAFRIADEIVAEETSELPGIPSKEPKAFEKPTVEEVREFCSSQGIFQNDADWFWFKCEGNGWKNGGKAIKNWRATLRSWKLAGYLPSQKVYQPNGRQQTVAPGSAATMTLAENQTQRELERARRVK